MLTKLLDNVLNVHYLAYFVTEMEKTNANYVNKVITCNSLILVSLHVKMDTMLTIQQESANSVIQTFAKLVLNPKITACHVLKVSLW